jgi:hypothetical protein
LIETPALDVELHTPGDPMCQHPIAFHQVAYIPRVGDLLWGPEANYKVLQIAQWADSRDSKKREYENKYVGRVCVMVEIHSYPVKRDA